MLPDPAQRLPTRDLSLTSARAFLKTYWRVLVLTGFVVVAAFVRMINITDAPRGFFTDEASFGLNADLILHTGRDEFGEFLPLLFRSFGEYKLPAFIYAEVPFMAIFGRTELAVRMTSAVLGSMTVVTIYLLAKELFRKDLAALASAATLVMLPWHIHYSRTGLGDIVILPLFFTFGFYLFFKAVKDERYIIPTAVVLALTFYTYRGGWVVLPPIMAVMAVAYREELLRHRTITLIAAGIFLAILAPLAYHLAFGPSDRTSQSWIFNLESEKSTFELFRDFYRSYFTDSFLFTEGDNGPVQRHYMLNQGQLYLIQLPLVLIGIVAMLGRLNRRYLFVLLLLVCYPLSASVSDTSPISSRAILGSVAFSLLTGAGLWVLVSTVSGWLKPQGRLVSIAVVLAVSGIALFSFSSYVNRYQENYPAEAAGYWGWQDGPQEIIAYFQEVEGQYDQMFLDGTFNAPEIFFRFYAEGTCEKCFIGGDDHYKPGTRQLFALRPDSMDLQQYTYRTIKTIYYEGGEVAFYLVEVTGRR